MTTTEEKRQEHLRRLQQLRPIDSDLMRCMLQDDIPLAQLVLRIITGKPDLVITKCQARKDPLTKARSFLLEAHGEDPTGKKYALVICKGDKEPVPQRAKYYSSLLDVKSLDDDHDYDHLPDNYIISIFEDDPYDRGEPVYVIQRVVLGPGEPFDIGKPFEDGVHFLYVNGGYRGEDELGQLMHDFSCTSADEMNFPLMAEKTRYLKESEEGMGIFCKAMEE